MNTITKMLLVPEDRFKDPVNLILSSDLPSDRKVRLANQVKLKQLDLKQQENIEAILNAELSITEKKALLENFYNTSRTEEDTPQEVQNNVSEEADLDQTLIAPQTPKKPEPLPQLPPIELSPIVKPSKLSAISSVPTSSRIARIATQNNEKMTLLLRHALQAIPGLVMGDKISTYEHIPLKNSNFNTIVNYLTSYNTGTKPHGTNHVLKVIREKYPRIMQFVTNPSVLSTEPSTSEQFDDQQWEALQTAYDMHIQNQKAQEASEE